MFELDDIEDIEDGDLDLDLRSADMLQHLWDVLAVQFWGFQLRAERVDPCSKGLCIDCQIKYQNDYANYKPLSQIMAERTLGTDEFVCQAGARHDVKLVEDMLRRSFALLD